MANSPQPADRDEREMRALWLQEWAANVETAKDSGHRMMEHSVTYGSTALQAAYILNGGALGALPPLIAGLMPAARANVPIASAWFVVGIVFAVIASLCAHLNYECLAEIAFRNSRNAASRLQALLIGEAPPPDESIAGYNRGAQWARGISMVAAVLSFVTFVGGAFAFMRLAA